MDYKEYAAKTVDMAITEACLDFGVTSDQLDYEVVSEGSSGFLGLGHKDAVIKARARSAEEMAAEARAIERAEKKDASLNEEPRFVSSDEIEKRAAAAAGRGGAGSAREERPKNSHQRGRGRNRRNGRGKDVEIKPYTPSKPKPARVISEKSEEEVNAMKTAAESFLTEVFRCMDVNVTTGMEYDQAEGCLGCTFAGEEMGLLIGKRGQTLDALQYLTSLVVNRNQNEYIRVKLDTEDYRARRADTLENLARNIAYKVKRTHKPVALEPMNPYERRIIHSVLQQNNFVDTYSEGDEPFRHVVVVPKKQ